MKLAIEESVLRQWKETFTHCYAETERRITDRAKALSEMQSALDAAEKVEPMAWMITTDNTNLHPLDPNKEGNWLTFDVNQFRNDSARALVISDTQPLYLHPALDAAERDELKQWLEDQVCEAKDFAYKLESKTVELAAVTKERDELVEALDQAAHRFLDLGEISLADEVNAALAKVGADKGEGS